MGIGMKKKIKNICLGALMICSLCLAGMTTEAAQLSSAESAVVDIETYEVEEGDLNPGEQITLNLKVKNNSEVTDAKNAVVTFESMDGALAPIYGDDNQIYIGTVPAGQTVNVMIEAIVNKQYKAEATQLKCYFTYVSGATPLSNTVAINIPTYVSGNLLVESAVVAENATVGVNSLVSIRCKNGGTTTITDAKLVVNGNVQEENREIMLPTIESGKTLAEDYYVSFTESGIQSLQLELQYTDAKGNVCTVNCGEYKVNVTNKVSGTDYDVVVEQMEGTSSSMLQVILLGAVVCMAAGVTIGYLKKRR